MNFQTNGEQKAALTPAAKKVKRDRHSEQTHR